MRVATVDAAMLRDHAKAEALAQFMGSFAAHLDAALTDGAAPPPREAAGTQRMNDTAPVSLVAPDSSRLSLEQPDLALTAPGRAQDAGDPPRDFGPRIPVDDRPAAAPRPEAPQTEVKAPASNHSAPQGEAASPAAAAKSAEDKASRPEGSSGRAPAAKAADGRSPSAETPSSGETAEASADGGDAGNATADASSQATATSATTVAQSGVPAPQGFAGKGEAASETGAEAGKAAAVGNLSSTAAGATGLEETSAMSATGADTAAAKTVAAAGPAPHMAAGGQPAPSAQTQAAAPQDAAQPQPIPGIGGIGGAARTRANATTVPATLAEGEPAQAAAGKAPAGALDGADAVIRPHEDGGLVVTMAPGGTGPVQMKVDVAGGAIANIVFVAPYQQARAGLEALRPAIVGATRGQVAMRVQAPQRDDAPEAAEPDRPDADGSVPTNHVDVKV